MAVAITAMVPKGRLTIAPPLVDRLPALREFQFIVRNGWTDGTSVMKGFAGDANVAPYIQDIYAYLQARADGALCRGRPRKFEPMRTIPSQ